MHIETKVNRKKDFAEPKLIDEENIKTCLRDLKSAINNVNKLTEPDKTNPEKTRINVKNVFIPRLIKDYNRLEKTFQVMLEQLSAKKQENQVLLLESQIKQIDVESYPIPSWPKILMAFSVALFTTGSALAGYFGDMLYGLPGYILGAVVMAFSFWKLNSEEEKRKERYDKLFPERDIIEEYENKIEKLNKELKEVREAISEK